MKVPGKTWVIGDIHGAHRALVQVLERSKFDFENDLLITLGDICDGWSEVSECVSELLRIKNRIDLKGNHDTWFDIWLATGINPVAWAQGGHATAQSYINRATSTDLDNPLVLSPRMGGWMTNLTTGDVPESHKRFFKQQINYYVDEKNRCFVHGGFDRDYPIADQDQAELCWDRDMWKKAMSCVGDQKLVTVDNFSEIFIGHTATVSWTANGTKMANGIVIPGNVRIDWPMERGGVTNLDTGAGWGGKLTIMNVDTHEYFQSDSVDKLYPDEKGRR